MADKPRRNYGGGTNRAAAARRPRSQRSSEDEERKPPTPGEALRRESRIPSDGWNGPPKPPLRDEIVGPRESTFKRTAPIPTFRPGDSKWYSGTRRPGQGGDLLKGQTRPSPRPIDIPIVRPQRPGGPATPDRDELYRQFRLENAEDFYMWDRTGVMPPGLDARWGQFLSKYYPTTRRV